MKVGDLVKLTTFAGRIGELRGIIINMYVAPRGAKQASVLWTDGDKTEEFVVHLEVVSEGR